MSFCSGVTAAPAHRPWRYLLAVAFVATIIGAFVPMVAIKYGRVTLGLTAMDLSFGMDKTRAVAEKELPKLPKVIGKRLESRLDSLRSDQTDLQLVLRQGRGRAAARCARAARDRWPRPARRVRGADQAGPRGRCARAAAAATSRRAARCDLASMPLR
jgi:hypothetical protein